MISTIVKPVGSHHSPAQDDDARYLEVTDPARGLCVGSGVEAVCTAVVG